MTIQLPLWDLDPALPEGFEYREAEYASGDSRATGPVSLEWTGRHAHVAMLDLSTHGAA